MARNFALLGFWAEKLQHCLHNGASTSTSLCSVLYDDNENSMMRKKSKRNAGMASFRLLDGGYSRPGVDWIVSVLNNDIETHSILNKS